MHGRVSQNYELVLTRSRTGHPDYIVGWLGNPPTVKRPIQAKPAGVGHPGEPAFSCVLHENGAKSVYTASAIARAVRHMLSSRDFRRRGEHGTQAWSSRSHSHPSRAAVVDSPRLSFCADLGGRFRAVGLRPDTDSGRYSRALSPNVRGL